mmetsp:Transcript_47734/g.123786  ORF Transcript_47734/g.123786 Transcript_47734/m.123786 type:complete len:308 (-) Transcript_47734:1620-2543(-)
MLVLIRHSLALQRISILRSPTGAATTSDEDEQKNGRTRESSLSSKRSARKKLFDSPSVSHRNRERIDHSGSSIRERCDLARQHALFSWREALNISCVSPPSPTATSIRQAWREQRARRLSADHEGLTQKDNADAYSQTPRITTSTQATQTAASPLHPSLPFTPPRNSTRSHATSIGSPSERTPTSRQSGILMSSSQRFNSAHSAETHGILSTKMSLLCRSLLSSLSVAAPVMEKADRWFQRNEVTTISPFWRGRSSGHSMKDGFSDVSSIDLSRASTRRGASPVVRHPHGWQYGNQRGSAYYPLWLH